jgi:hypothetical protein
MQDFDSGWNISGVGRVGFRCVFFAVKPCKELISSTGVKRLEEQEPDGKHGAIIPGHDSWFSQCRLAAFFFKIPFEDSLPLSTTFKPLQS